MTVTDSNSATLFLEFSRHKLLEQYWPRLRACVESLTDEQVWWRPNDASNSIGNLVLHLNGNVRQWLLEQIGATMQQASETLSRLTETDLLASFEIQGYNVHGLAAVYQVVEHFGLHYGQILYVTKMLRGEDLSFYRELSETGRAS
jgi:hypothetical protein